MKYFLMEKRSPSPDTDTVSSTKRQHGTRDRDPPHVPIKKRTHNIF